MCERNGIAIWRIGLKHLHELDFANKKGTRSGLFGRAHFSRQPLSNHSAVIRPQPMDRCPCYPEKSSAHKVKLCQLHQKI